MTATKEEIEHGRSILAYFNTIPWCSSLLKAPNTTIYHHLPRHNNTGGLTEHAFWNRTLATPDTIRGVLSITSSNLAAEYPRINEYITLFSLGPGLAGYGGMCHGGMISVLLDEATGTLIHLLEEIETREVDGYARKSAFTLDTQMTYKKAVPAPGVVLVRSTLERLNGKQRLVHATIEDENGNVLCEARYNFIVLNKGRGVDLMAKLRGIESLA